MARLHVTCIVKHPTNQDRHHAIQEIGGAWGKHSQALAITYIETGANSYYATGGGSEANVKVQTREGKKYLVTDKDTTTKDNLLSLPRCG
jgi:hypothetical protein